MDPSKRKIPRQRDPRHAGTGRYLRDAAVSEVDAIREQLTPRREVQGAAK
jgi:hypothetical protein